MRPTKTHGLTDHQRTRMCTGKHRWPDQLSAMAGAVASLERHPEAGKLYTYHCPACGGFHLTKRKQKGQRPVTLEAFKEPPCKAA